MELEQVIRHIYRVPVEKGDQVSVTVDGAPYEVLNLGSQGIGISLPDPPPFTVDGQGHDIGLQIGGELLRLIGEIVHISPYGADNYLCGIKLINMDDGSQGRLLACVYRIRANLFTKD